MKQLTTAYLRVSPSESTANETIANQRAFLIRYAQTQQIELLPWYEDDGISGETPMERRPSGYRMLRDAAEGKFDTLLVYRIDRLGRNTLDSLQIAGVLKRHGVGIVSMTEPFDTSGPTGEFVFTLLAAVAQMERKTIRQRTALGKAQAASNGRWNGGRTPYGYLVVERFLQIEPVTAAVVRRLFALYRDGNCLSGIALLLNAEGIPSPANGEWNKTTLSKILRNRTYIGEGAFRRHSSAETITYAAPALIDSELFEEVQSLLARNPLSARRSRRYYYLLAGLVHCRHCGGTLTGHTDASRGKLYPYYRCTECRMPMLPAAQIEGAIWAHIEALAANPGDAIKKLRFQTQQYLQIEDEADGIEAAQVTKRQEREKAISLCRKGIITEEDLQGQLAQIADETAALAARLDQLRGRQDAQVDMRRRLSDAEELILKLKERTQIKSAEARQRIINQLVERVFVAHDGTEHHADVITRFDLTSGTIALAIVTEGLCLRAA